MCERPYLRQHIFLYILNTFCHRKYEVDGGESDDEMLLNQSRTKVSDLLNSLYSASILPVSISNFLIRNDQCTQMWSNVKLLITIRPSNNHDKYVMGLWENGSVTTFSLNHQMTLMYCSWCGTRRFSKFGWQGYHSTGHMLASRVSKLKRRKWECVPVWKPLFQNNFQFL